jgi:hypothetical protein
MNGQLARPEMLCDLLHGSIPVAPFRGARPGVPPEAEFRQSGGSRHHELLLPAHILAAVVPSRCALCMVGAQHTVPSQAVTITQVSEFTNRFAGCLGGGICSYSSQVGRYACPAPTCDQEHEPAPEFPKNWRWALIGRPAGDAPNSTNLHLSYSRIAHPIAGNSQKAGWLKRLRMVAIWAHTGTIRALGRRGVKFTRCSNNHRKFREFRNFSLSHNNGLAC